MRLAVVTAALLGLLAAVPVPAPAVPPPQEPLVEQVRRAIDRGRDYLVRQQLPNGTWEYDGTRSRPGGWTALALLALLNAGAPADDPVIQNGLKYLRTVPPAQTYVVGLQTMVYCLAGHNEDRERIKRNVDWLVQARVMNGKELRGWTYTAGGGDPDNSNTQYALLGLHEAQVAGFTIDPEVWQSIRDFYKNTQQAGGWGYKRHMAPTMTMTTAGLCGLVIAGMDLNQGREVPGADGRWQNCGDYEENRAVAMALEWVSDRFPAANDLGRQPHLYYALYGFERAGRLTGLRYFGPHDWYRVGCEFLVGRQNPDGSWRGGGNEDSAPVIATSFALLFLSKGRTPILVSKIVHAGRDGARLYPEDWNNDRNDARHLVEFASRELFKRQAMGWQVFNTRAVEATVDELVAELLPSPIAYISGHYAPDFSREARLKEVLVKYVENGGFILAEACCGRPEFDKGFRDLMKELFPDTPLTPLPDDHPIWTASGKFAVPPNRRFPLEGIQMGCKTIVVYSPRDLSCWWESNRHQDGDGQTAFRLGANIIAYATGLEPPRPRLATAEVFRDDPKEREVPRGFLKVGQVRHEGDWQPAPRAMPNLMRELREKARLDVALQVKEVYPHLPEVIDFKLLYMHGRRDFRLPKEKLGDLRFNLETGGLLFADACCGAAEFRKAFEGLIDDLWPGKKLERIPLTDELFGKELNGAPLTEVRCRRQKNGRYEAVEPLLEGVKINGRWAVIFSPFDIGCALEKTKSPSCLGHDYESAVRLGSAVVLYALKR